MIRFYDMETQIQVYYKPDSSVKKLIILLGPRMMYFTLTREKDF